MDLDSTLLFTRRWIWLFALCAISAAAVGLVVSLLTPPTYESTATLLVGHSLETNQVDYNDILASKEMAQTYAEMATFSPVIEAAAASMTPPMDPGLYAKSVRVRAPASSTFVEIVGVGSSAQQAADIANALANELIVIATPPPPAPTATPSPTPRPTPAPSLAPGQTATPTASPTPAPSAAAATADAGSGSLTLVDPATPPSSSVGPRTILNTVVAGLIGLAIGIIAAFVLARPGSEDRT